MTKLPELVQPPKEIAGKKYYDPATKEWMVPRPVRKNTLDSLRLYNFKDDADNKIEWTWGQIEIIDCILNRSSPNGLKRVQILASTQYGKSMAVGAGLAIRASVFPEKWAVVAGTDEKAKIIMEYVIMFSTGNPIILSQLTPETSIEQLRMKKSASRLVFKKLGEVRVYSANATRVSETSKSLMGFGAPNVIEDESALVPDILQATVMRMLGGKADNFLAKIGNPFHRNHFLRTWKNGKYYRVFIDYNRARDEGRYSDDFIEEMRAEALFEILYGCLFSSGEDMDAKGWLPLLTEDEIRRAFVKEIYFFGERRLGGDVAGGGRNYSTMALRSSNALKLVYKKDESDTMLYAGNVLLFKSRLAVADNCIFIDKVGIGRGAYDRLHEQRQAIVGINAGSTPSDNKRYFNLRAEMYWRFREWILKGGKIVENNDWFQLNEIKYKVSDSNGKIQIMSKQEMLKNGIDSPDVADAGSLTFSRVDAVITTGPQTHTESVSMGSLDPFAKKRDTGVVQVVNQESLDPYAR